MPAGFSHPAAHPDYLRARGLTNHLNRTYPFEPDRRPDLECALRYEDDRSCPSIVELAGGVGTVLLPFPQGAQRIAAGRSFMVSA